MENKFKQTVAEQILKLERAIREEGWEISNHVVENLARVAPAWPEGRAAFRCFRIRFEEADEGVRITAQAHLNRINRIFGGQVFFGGMEKTDSQHLRLLAGNHTHKPTVEWVTFDLEANRQRESISAVRGPQSLADEFLVFAWMFPQYIRSLDDSDCPIMYAGGYEISTEDPPDLDPRWRDEVPWHDVPFISFEPRINYENGEVAKERFFLGNNWYCDSSESCSVPALL